MVERIKQIEEIGNVEKKEDEDKVDVKKMEEKGRD